MGKIYGILNKDTKTNYIIYIKKSLFGFFKVKKSSLPGSAASFIESTVSSTHVIHFIDDQGGPTGRVHDIKKLHPIVSALILYTVLHYQQLQGMAVFIYVFILSTYLTNRWELNGHCIISDICM